MMAHHYRQFAEANPWVIPTLLVLIAILHVGIFYAIWLLVKREYHLTRELANRFVEWLFERRRKRLQRLWEKENLR